jgi:asparagine synthase (glutamine-hydrolysing)
VVLTGEGADETLGGYPWYMANKILGPLAGWPVAARVAAARGLAGRWPGAAQILTAPAEMNLERFHALIGSPGRNVPPDLFAFDGGERNEWRPPEAFHGWHPFVQLQYLDMKWRMADSVIAHVDLCSMAYSLEARVPFLDHVLVEFCATIPPWIKLRGLREKHVLRRAMRGVLPAEICWRKKFGLSAPTRDLVAGLLPQLAGRANGWFNPSQVATLIAQHQQGQANHSRLLLLIWTTQLWDELFLKRFSCATT